jgi:6-pyruvoyltetrahydropterin/6-carboxytetrahydropterin synthase
MLPPAFALLIFGGGKMYEITIETGFSAAHKLKNYRGKCENLHGHNWKVAITVESGQLDDTGLAMDFTELRAHAQKIMEKFDHKNLSELPEFKKQNPTTENIARIIYEILEQILKNHTARIKKVSVAESEKSRASYRKN